MADRSIKAEEVVGGVFGCTGMIVLTGALVQIFAHYQLRSLLGIDRMQSQIDRPGGPSFLHPGEGVRIDAGGTVVLVVRSTKVAAGSIFAEPKKAIKVGQGYRPA